MVILANQDIGCFSILLLSLMFSLIEIYKPLTFDKAEKQDWTIDNKLLTEWTLTTLLLFHVSCNNSVRFIYKQICSFVYKLYVKIVTGVTFIFQLFSIHIDWSAVQLSYLKVKKNAKSIFVPYYYILIVWRIVMFSVFWLYPHNAKLILETDFTADINCWSKWFFMP